MAITNSREYVKALKRAGFVLVRTGKHYIYRHPSGVRAVVSKGTRAMDPRAFKNNIADLRRQGIELEER